VIQLGHDYVERPSYELLLDVREDGFDPASGDPELAFVAQGKRGRRARRWSRAADKENHRADLPQLHAKTSPPVPGGYPKWLLNRDKPPAPWLATDR
jgi:hypothetical protein